MLSTGAVATGEQSLVPENLFHTLLTASKDSIDSQRLDSRTTFPLASHATLDAAKSFALKALPLLGYSHMDFDAYEERVSDEDNEETGAFFQDGIIVHAQRSGAHDFLIGIVTTPNNEKLQAKTDGSGELQLPLGTNHLHYVLQTRIDYNTDRAGAFQETVIEGTYVRRSDALAASKKCLISDEVGKKDFVLYEEQDKSENGEEWAYGEDVLVHAVSESGENFKITVATPLLAHQRHKKN
ncbi:hypothetical protein VHEMI05873 [[Torrubiella] hemipterigena]|uniref:Uncharacterized protein n=1 Tax=[Torrubiella] hemipterigena TaxID=1531966 RepID=A0A0A1THQ8_9HYPO|nr:hypothetical protein VHEMI05873 [[Torrubiella] hemipterigena]